MFSKRIGGYEWPVGQVFCEAAKRALRKCSKLGAAYLEVDDGPHPELAQLKAVDGEYFTYIEINEHQHVIIDLNRF